MNMTTNAGPPFQQANGIFFWSNPLSVPTQTGSGTPAAPQQNRTGSTVLDLVLPALFQDVTRRVRTLKVVDTSDTAVLRAYFAKDLNVDRLLKIFKHLYLAGLPHGPKALHAQILIGRQICITQKADLHLLWKGTRIFMKPLPDYLMCHEIWRAVLCPDRQLYQDANGLLLSYLWLICDQCDLSLARDLGLISKHVTWSIWSNFSKAVSSKLDLSTLNDINPRYVYGELRLSRINSIYRFCSRTTNLTTFLRGYEYDYHEYSTFIKRNFTWFLTLIVYIGLVLTAMQVGLGTLELETNHAFNRACYGFTVFSILAPLLVIGAVAIIILILASFNARYTLARREEASQKYKSAFNSSSVRRFKH